MNEYLENMIFSWHLTLYSGILILCTWENDNSKHDSQYLFIIWLL